MILLFSSRILCYESNLIFIRKISDTLRSLGEETKIIELDEDWERELMSVEGGKYKAIIDFNSMLPRMENDDGSLYLDRFDAPFFNYVVDHPMYHHPGLVANIKDYRVLTVDKCHEAYVNEHYKNVKECTYLPLTGESDRYIDFDKRQHEILVMATMTDEKLILNDIKKFPPEYQKYMHDLCDMMFENPYATQEDIASDYIKREGLDIEEDFFPVFMNNICMADKMVRYRRRERFVTSLIKSGLPITLVGNGWESTLDKLNAKNVSYKGEVGFGVSYAVMANSKVTVNLSPEFHGGVHDRVYSAMAQGSCVVTDKNPMVENEFHEGSNVIMYDRGNVDDFLVKTAFAYDNGDVSEKIGRAAMKYYQENDTWRHRMYKFLDLLL